MDNLNSMSRNLKQFYEYNLLKVQVNQIVYTFVKSVSKIAQTPQSSIHSPLWF